MPEIHENTIGNKLCQLFIEQQATADRTLDSIYTDVTDKEPCHCASPNVCPATQGHVHEILSNSPRLKTGVTGTEGNGLYPAMYSTTSMPVPVSRRGLVLQEAEIDARNYILKFLDNNRKECWIQLQPLTHTVVQIYTKEDWIGTISKVGKDVRGFKVALAFKFQKHVMAFVSQDLLFKVFWKHLRKDLPVQYVDIYQNPVRFLEDLVTWMLERRGGRGCLKPKPRTQNALLLVRDSPNFHGVGLYSVTEIWHKAGLSPTLTEGELFDSPSRTARLCGAYYHFAYVGHNELWDFTKKHLHGYVVAAHTKDRKHFSNFLHVWGQHRSYLSQRHFDLLEKHKKTGDVDAFEPELIRHAFSCTAVDLGSLIFGQEVWEKLSLAQGLSTPNLTENTLKKHFSIIKAKKSGLDLSAYKFLFHAENIPRPLSKKWKRTNCYRSGQRDIWSVYPDASPPFEAILGDQRLQRLLGFVTQHRNTYTVGPLDYCGTAKLVHGSGKDVMMICEYDPQVSEFYITRRVLEKETVKLKAKRVEHSGIEPALKRKLMRMVSTHSSSPSSLPISTDQRPRKRLRRSADRDMSISLSTSTISS